MYPMTTQELLANIEEDAGIDFAATALDKPEETADELVWLAQHHDERADSPHQDLTRDQRSELRAVAENLRSYAAELRAQAARTEAA